MSPRRPIVLLRKRGSASVTHEVAPGNPRLGVMLPYTPLHHLLMREMDGLPLVMTSANRSDEPIVCQEAEAVEVLHGICDLFLTHDRPIHVRCDDSVTRIIDGMESPVRRSRGYAPQPIALPAECGFPILAVGGQLKGAFAFGNGRRAVLSHHMGDLDHFKAFNAFRRDIALYEELFNVKPSYIAHDLHPDYVSTRYAQRRGVPCIGIQHHHAHMASCMAEHGLNEPVIGVTFDGTGFGPDGAVWGGEFLVGDYSQFNRVAHFRYVAMPGGERAIREPWRMAAAYLFDAQAECGEFSKRISATSTRFIQTMIQRKLNCPQTSSMGRLFDAVASLIGIQDHVNYEGQAAIRLEEFASSIPDSGTYPFEISSDAQDPWVIDTRPIILSIVRETNSGIKKEYMARRFHSTLVGIVSDICSRVMKTTGIYNVVLSGGTFMNELLSVEVKDRLTRQGMRVYRHQLVPTNDGGLCLGQLVIAANRINSPR